MAPKRTICTSRDKLGICDSREEPYGPCTSHTASKVKRSEQGRWQSHWQRGPRYILQVPTSHSCFSSDQASKSSREPRPHNALHCGLSGRDGLSSRCHDRLSDKEVADRLETGNSDIMAALAAVVEPRSSQVRWQSHDMLRQPVMGLACSQHIEHQ